MYVNIDGGHLRDKKIHRNAVYTTVDNSCFTLIYNKRHRLYAEKI